MRSSGSTICPFENLVHKFKLRHHQEIGLALSDPRTSTALASGLCFIVGCLSGLFYFWRKPRAVLRDVVVEDFEELYKRDNGE